MTLKEMFKKVEAYNEVAELMRAPKAKIEITVDKYWGETFEDYSSLRKHAKREYSKELADIILNDDGFEFDGEIERQWVDSFGWNGEATISAELVT